MMIIKNVSTLDGQLTDLSIQSQDNIEIDAKGLTALPAVIDPHVHFRTPGFEYKEDWRTATKAALRGGCSMVFDMPNTLPPTITSELLAQKKAIINQQIAETGLPLRYELFFGADKHHLAEIPLVKNDVIGIKVFMGCSTGNLVIDDDDSLSEVFSIAAKNKMLVAVHAEDEHLMHERKKMFSDRTDYPVHSQIRNIDVATRAVEKALMLAKKYGTRLYILHVSTADEAALIKAAKKSGVTVHAETTPHHLFFNDSQYDSLKGKAVVNPPLRDALHHDALLNAIHDGTIDTLGSDHAPHTLEEKSKPYGQCPSGMPGIEFMLPMLLNAHHEKKLSLNEIVKLTSANAKSIFHLPDFSDWVLVDLAKTETVTTTKSKCGFTPYAGLTLTGWPIYTIVNGKAVNLLTL